MGSQYEKGRLYQWNGQEFVELEPSGETKIPVTEEAMNAVKAVRKAAQAVIGMRPELSLVASAMLLEASRMPGVADAVKLYGQRIYSAAVAPLTDGNTAPLTGGDTQLSSPVTDVVDTPDSTDHSTDLTTPAGAAAMLGTVDI
ncbi:MULTISPECIES: hypothetical protein [Burkholderia]|uniref:hypothetical protein n=1 Tax=Burkholderia TaxID=32008 RepID=UPI0016418E08|nr:MULTISPECIES: hypothetical protein [Burkholderia]UVS94938.1 hypothetical protein EFP19_03520 [Burkholderia glumae]